MSDSPDYPSSSNSSHSSRRLDSSSLMSSGSSPIIHVSSGSISGVSSRSSSPVFLGYFPKQPASRKRPLSPAQDNNRLPSPARTMSATPSQATLSPATPSLVTANPAMSSPATSNPATLSPARISPDRNNSSSTEDQPNPMFDVLFGRCVTPGSPPTNSLLIEPTAMVSLPTPTSPASSSSSEDEIAEAKRLKSDPDYIPLTSSEGTQSATISQEVSEAEEEIEDQFDTETEEESWQPSESTEPEEVSSSDDSL
jgi:hypothetical protein